jgi:membrane complex biogenesis BtpA family protein
MIHLAPLPGAPGYEGTLDAVLEAAQRDAVTLETAGFDGIMIENFGDAPFFADDVPKTTVAAMTRAVATVRDAVALPIGVNVLRNDALAAMSIAAATGAAFIRVNVLSGTMWTDQGPISGRGAELARLRRSVAPDVAVMADVFVKHATPPPGLTIEQATHDLAGRGGADAIIVSGTGTGSPPTIATLRTVRAAAPDRPLYLGSGVAAGTVAKFLGVADGVIAGTSLKQHGVTTNPVAAKRARDFVAAARRRPTRE